MRLVTSMMTTKEMLDNDVENVVKIFRSKFNNRIEAQKFKYDDRRYYEVDIDIFEISFSKEKIYDNINNLISIYEEILVTISSEIDFIVANDDTDSEILRYEKDKNDIKDFGLFVTKRKISCAKPYYSSEICSAYVNLTYVSFGVYY